jgi:hypothetical protein
MTVTLTITLNDENNDLQKAAMALAVSPLSLAMLRVSAAFHELPAGTDLIGERVSIFWEMSEVGYAILTQGEP